MRRPTYNGGMSGWSFGIGKFFGVEIRVHSFFLFLLLPASIWASIEGRPALRGFTLWLLLLAAVAVRELARSIAAAAYSLDLKSILLLPTGGLMSYANPEMETRAGEGSARRGMALTGPIANLLFGLMILGIVLTISPSVEMVNGPWISPAHLLRAFVWLNLFLAALNLLPAWPLDAGRIGGGLTIRRPGAAKASDEAKASNGQMGALLRLNAVKSTGFLIGLSLIVSGILIRNWWMLMGGVFLLLGGQIERQGLTAPRPTDSTTVGEVMLTDYSVLPASATLEDAMLQARHSLQDVFPVVRAGNMVGAVGRQNILDALATTGNGYVQGIMTRSFQTATVEQSLMETLDKAVAHSGGSLQIVPVIAGDMVLGILTPQHLQRSLGLITRVSRRAGRATEDQSV